MVTKALHVSVPKRFISVKHNVPEWSGGTLAISSSLKWRENTRDFAVKFVGFYNYGVHMSLPTCVIHEQNCYKTQSGTARFRE